MIHVFHPPILSQQDFMHVATYASLYFNIFINYYNRFSRFSKKKLTHIAGNLELDWY